MDNQKVTGLPFEDALALMKLGYKIRLSSWPEYEFWFLDKFEALTQVHNSYMSNQDTVETYVVFHIEAEAILANNWEVVT